MDIAQAGRPLYWNIHVVWPLYAMFAVALAIFAAGLWRRVASWRRGKPAGERLGDRGKRLWLLARELLWQRRTRGGSGAGLLHAAGYASFLVLVAATTAVAIDVDLKGRVFRGWTYAVLTLGSDLGGLLILVACGAAAWRRLSTRPATLQTGFADTGVLLGLALLMLTGFAAEALRIAARGDPWAWLSPVGWGLSILFRGLSTPAAEAAHLGLWWLHGALAMAFIAAIPHTKLFHLLALPTNVFFSKLTPRGALKRVDLEAVMSADDFDEATFTLGTARAGDFTWKQRLDFDACISCGRCEEVCPSFRAGEPFSPKRFIHAGRDLVAESLRAAAPARPAEGQDGAGAGEQAGMLVGARLSDEFIWFCRTCSACTEVCPAAIDHVDSMIDVRRNELMVQGRVPPEASRALKLLESQGNPFGKRPLRAQWIKEMRVPVVPAGGEVEVLYWIGCLSSYDLSKQKIAADLFQLLDRAGVSWGVLGGDEGCCGDPARVLGDERLFQDIAKAQVETLKSRKFRTILVHCPHCLNTLANEYPQFGGSFRVVHHAAFLRELVESGRLKPSVPLEGSVVFHDPCYLGRYQGEYDAPRELLGKLPVAGRAEMASCKERSLCCGGGGGHYWMDLKVEGAERASARRIDEAVATGAGTVVTGCPYCHQMLGDAAKLRNVDKKVKVQDLATLLVRSLAPAASEPPAAAKAP